MTGSRQVGAQEMDDDSDLLDFDDTRSEFFLPQRSEPGTRTRLVVGIDFGTT